MSGSSVTRQKHRLLVENFHFTQLGSSKSTLLNDVAFSPSDKPPPLRQLSGKSLELELPLLRPSGDDLEEDEEEEEGEEITLH